MAHPPGRDPHRPKKSLGQNFLTDPNLQRKIVRAIDPSPLDEVLEIGPGTGALTRHLVGNVRRLVLIELDDVLARRLAEEFAGNPSVEVLHADFLDVPLERISRDPSRLKVIGNIPYNITTPIIFALLERRPRPAEIVLMVQREVADRILAGPGTKTYGALAVGVQAVASVLRVVNVARTAFRPPPDVDSTVIRITPAHPPALDPATESALRTLTRAAFGQRRKQFQRILRDAFALDPCRIEELTAATGLDLRDRPERVSPADFIRLTRALVDAGGIQS
ncbi:MAG: 16S rRNA (adenine(1518)-N(6)/adenine(1519)-N(6))-dimethyltransferase RsmA [Gemmatimonadota bacterium]